MQLATADVPTASNSAAAVNKSLDAAAKTAVLTVDDSALMRSCNPKALASLVTIYLPLIFDIQLAGTLGTY